MINRALKSSQLSPTSFQSIIRVKKSKLKTVSLFSEKEVPMMVLKVGFSVRNSSSLVLEGQRL